MIKLVYFQGVKFLPVSRQATRPDVSERILLRILFFNSKLMNITFPVFLFE